MWLEINVRFTSETSSSDRKSDSSIVVNSFSSSVLIVRLVLDGMWFSNNTIDIVPKKSMFTKSHEHALDLHVQNAILD